MPHQIEHETSPRISPILEYMYDVIDVNNPDIFILNCVLWIISQAFSLSKNFAPGVHFHKYQTSWSLLSLQSSKNGPKNPQLKHLGKWQNFQNFQRLLSWKWSEIYHYEFILNSYLTLHGWSIAYNQNRLKRRSGSIWVTACPSKKKELAVENSGLHSDLVPYWTFTKCANHFQTKSFHWILFALPSLKISWVFTCKLWHISSRNTLR